MAPAGTTANTGSLDDALDDLYNYEVPAEENVFRPFDSMANAAAPSVPQTSSKASTQPKGLTAAADLGIDEEIKVKARRKVPKLDEELLLSQKGIPKLRRITRERLRLKGKGHEFTDIARLLTLYQLWLDDLYPRAKFADALAMIEKLGHSRRLQTMRREWIDEAKPRVRGGERDDGEEGGRLAERGERLGMEKEKEKEKGRQGGEGLEGEEGEGRRGDMDGDAGERNVGGVGGAPRVRAVDVDREMGLFVTDYEDDGAGRGHNHDGSSGDGVEKRSRGMDVDIDDDELDALLAEDEASEQSERRSATADPTPPIKAGGGTRQTEEDFDDDMEAMAGMEFDY